MKEILIISYFYPPCTLTAAQRPAGWVKYLPQLGYKPIVITRNWDVTLSKPEDQLKDAGSQLYIEKSETHEVHYLPYKASLRDRLFNSKNSLLKKCSKIFTFMNSIGENFSNQFIPFGDFYEYAESLIQKHTFTSIIITGNPFIQFRFGYLLSNKFHIPWIADYRDDWTTSEIIQPKGKFESFIHRLQQNSEQKWVGTASMITSVSPVYTDRISQFVKVPGETILNGFDELLPKIEIKDNNSFIIVYNGTLYDTQDLEGFVRVIIRCIELFRNKINIQIHFPGVCYDPKQESRLKALIQGYESFFLLTPRIPKEDVIKLQQQADLLLMLTHREKKGIPSSKLYEYLAIQKPILCFPSDQDIVTETLLNTGLGFVSDNEELLFDKVNEFIRLKLNGREIINETKEENFLVYSHSYQVSKLSLLLNQIS
jgi:glycosyltransferase involved in cell wall biosynthesis